MSLDFFERLYLCIFLLLAYDGFATGTLFYFREQGFCAQTTITSQFKVADFTILVPNFRIMEAGLSETIVLKLP